MISTGTQCPEHGRVKLEAGIDLMNQQAAKAWAAKFIRETGVIPFVAGVVFMAAATFLAALVLKYFAGM